MQNIYGFFKDLTSGKLQKKLKNQDKPTNQRLSLEECLLKRQAAGKMKKTKQQLTDKTKVDGMAWQTLKLKAMRPDYIESSWFKALSPEDKEKVEELRVAQRNQGNM